MKISDWFKPKEVSTPKTRAEVFEAVNNSRRCVQILLANKNPDAKRKLGVYGKYDQWRDDAVKALLDDAFYLSVALTMIRQHKSLSNRFGQFVAEVNQYATATLNPNGELVPPKEGPEAAIPVLTPAPALETDGIPFVPKAKG